MSRYREIAVGDMDPAQKRAHNQIVSGKRGRFVGPFQLLIRAPGVCEHAAPLGEYLRWGTSLPDRLSELAIITTTRFWWAQYEWYAQAPLAEQAGVPGAAIEAIRTGGTPISPLSTTSGRPVDADVTCWSTRRSSIASAEAGIAFLLDRTADYDTGKRSR